MRNRDRQRRGHKADGMLPPSPRNTFAGPARFHGRKPAHAPANANASPATSVWPRMAARTPIPAAATPATEPQAPSRLSMTLKALTAITTEAIVSPQSNTGGSPVFQPRPAANRAAPAPPSARTLHPGPTPPRSSTVPRIHRHAAQPRTRRSLPLAPARASPVIRNAASTAAPPRNGVGARCFRYPRGRSRKSVRRAIRIATGVRAKDAPAAAIKLAAEVSSTLIRTNQLGSPEVGNSSLKPLAELYSWLVAKLRSGSRDVGQRVPDVP